nr:putative leucine-rich repeat receptor-like protein kinase At2g19210 [Ipomoea batatas]
MDKAVGLAMQAYVEVVLLLLCCYALTNVVVNAQTSAEFISIDCGLEEGGGYEDEKTKIVYHPDAGFIESGGGVSASIEIGYIRNDTDKHLWTVRSFPSGYRNCYDLSGAEVERKRVLIRASFHYGNYDGKNETPKIVHVPQYNILKVCLVNTGKGTPFVSALELRTLDAAAYPTNASLGTNESLALFTRLNYGGNEPVRYPDDVRDRIWYPSGGEDLIPLIPTPPPLNPNQPIAPNNYQVPSKVMGTALSINDTAEGDLQLSWEPDDPKTNYYVYLHFAELTRLQPNQTRAFNILRNDKLWYDRPVSPVYWTTTTILTQNPGSDVEWKFKLVKTEDSTLPPLINAVEIYAVKRFLKSQTGQSDGDIQVAVKVLSQSSVQGYHEFQTEAELLTRVHHRDLTSLVGYCYEDENTALVYEFMANGNLRDVLSEKSSHVLSWVERLQIATDAAQEKSDVYSFGIVILELISGRPSIVMNDVKPHIIQWANFFLETGDIRKIIDPRLKEEFEVNCVWKALELAMACTSPISIKRPNMGYVVTELKECLTAEKARREGNEEAFYSEEVLEVMPIARDNNSIIGPR